VKHREEVTKGLNILALKWNVTNVTTLDTWPKIREWQSLLENHKKITRVTDRNLKKGHG
jgi:hypothetical protein